MAPTTSEVNGSGSRLEPRASSPAHHPLAWKECAARVPRLMPIVSVIVPIHNYARFLPAAVESVLRQSYTDWELLLADDGSTDGSAAIAADYADRLAPRVRLLRHPGGANRGVSATRNLALAEARGEYVAFLDADDLWLPERLARQVPILEKMADVGIVYARAACVAEDGTQLAQPTGPYMLQEDLGCGIAGKPFEAYASFLRGVHAFPGHGYAPVSTVLARRRLLEEIGGFPLGLTYQVEDHITWTRLARHARAYFLPERLALYRVHAASWSGRQNPLSKLDAHLECLRRLTPEGNAADPAWAETLAAFVMAYLKLDGVSAADRLGRAREVVALLRATGALRGAGRDLAADAYAVGFWQFCAQGDYAAAAQCAWQSLTLAPWRVTSWRSAFTAALWRWVPFARPARPPTARAVATLGPRLRGPHTATRRGVAAVLASAAGPEAAPLMPLLTEALQDEDAEVRRDVAWAFCRVGEAVGGALTMLRLRVDDEDLQVRRASAAALAWVAGPEAADVLPVLSEGLADPSPESRRGTAWALQGLGSEARPAYPDLIRLLADADPTVRHTAAATLAAGLGLRPEDPAELLRELLRDEEPAIRRAAITVLRSNFPTAFEAIPLLMDLLHDDDEETRQLAAGAAAHLIGPDAVGGAPVLRDALRGSDALTRRNAAWALFRLGEAAADAVPELREALEDGDPGVRRAVAAALARIAGPDAEDVVPVLAEALEDAPNEMTLDTIWAVWHIGPAAAAAAPALSRHLDAADAPTRHAAAKTLALCLGPEALAAVPVLREALTDPDPDSRAGAAWSLQNVGPPARAAVPDLLQLLHDPDDAVRHAALAALGQIDPDAVPPGASHPRDAGATHS